VTSRRLRWEQADNAIAVALAARRAAGLPIFDLTESNPTRVGLPLDERRVLAALADPRALRYEPSPLGLPTAREAVARYCAESRGVAIDPGRILLTASTSEAYALIFKLLCDPGDCVLVPEPSYPLFGYLTALEAVETAAYPLAYDGEWHLDLPELAAQLSANPRARAVLVVSPGNPTGAFLKQPERERLVALCARHGCALVSDEVFADFAAADDARRVPTIAARPRGATSAAAISAAAGAAATARGATGTVTLRGAAAAGAGPQAGAQDDVLAFSLSGLSKVCGLPQLKLAWCVVSGPRAEADKAMAGLELIADTYLSVSTQVQVAAGALLETRHGFQRALRARLAHNRATLASARTPDASWSLLNSEGGWSAILSVPRRLSEEEWALSLLAQGLLLHPGYFFDLPGSHLVVSLLLEEAAFAAAAARLSEALDGS
jgi:aspartate/methionine/tyrosine aminotransferase